jgi:hypothetical protein
MEIQNSTELVNQPIKIQCTWANCFTEPVWDRGLCIRSYDRKVLERVKCTDGVIGKLTGNYHKDDKGVMWLEATLFYCNRRSTGWFREINVWYATKGTLANVEDESLKKTGFNWAWWLSAGVTALKLFSN